VLRLISELASTLSRDLLILVVLRRITGLSAGLRASALSRDLLILVVLRRITGLIAGLWASALSRDLLILVVPRRRITGLIARLRVSAQSRDLLILVVRRRRIAGLIARLRVSALSRDLLILVVRRRRITGLPSAWVCILLASAPLSLIVLNGLWLRSRWGRVVGGLGLVLLSVRGRLWRCALLLRFVILGVHVHEASQQQ